jgi:HlyD family secretion protein
MKKYLIPLFIVAIVAGCGRNKSEADAWGSFESDEVIISSESSGRIVSMPVEEGMTIGIGAVISVTDTVMLQLQRAEVSAALASAQSRLTTISSQNAVLKQQMDNLQINIDRTKRMLADNASTQKQLDDLTGQMDVLKLQMAANNTQRSTVAAEIGSVNAKGAILDEQIRRSTVKSPINGTVIEKYVMCHELTAPGKPLVKMSDMRVMKLKVWVSGAQLARVKNGAPCTVRIDDGAKGYKSFTGTISHISDKAEFTPKIIQTKEERVALVYAVTIDVPNDGSIKSGMPGEAIFKL